MVASSGRGKPRPLLEGVFRKACDYCVRSKRGCNGGTPCEQCIRRDQCCTYSQRRKSGPRGRPLRQQASPPLSPLDSLSLGTRISARRTTKRNRTVSARQGSLSLSSPHLSSPARTSSMSSSSSSSQSEYSPSDESCSDSDTEAAAAAGAAGAGAAAASLSSFKQKRQPVIHGKQDKRDPPASKFRKISNTKERSVQQVSIFLPRSKVKPASASPFPVKTPTTTTTTTSTTTNTITTTAIKTVVQPKEMKLNVPDMSIAGKRIVFPTRMPSPSTVSALCAAPKRSASVVTPTQLMIAPEPSVINITPQKKQEKSEVGQSDSKLIVSGAIMPIRASVHEIKMQPWEISHPVARPVIFDESYTAEVITKAISSASPSTSTPKPPSAGIASQASLAGMGSTDDAQGTALFVDVAAIAVAASSGSTQIAVAAPVSPYLSASSTASLSSSLSCLFEGVLMSQEEELRDSDFDKDLDLACPSLGVPLPPSLSREISLARAVDALGTEHMAHVGCDGIFIGCFC